MLIYCFLLEHLGVWIYNPWFRFMLLRSRQHAFRQQDIKNTTVPEIKTRIHAGRTPAPLNLVPQCSMRIWRVKDICISAGQGTRMWGTCPQVNGSVYPSSGLISFCNQQHGGPESRCLHFIWISWLTNPSLARPLLVFPAESFAAVVSSTDPPSRTVWSSTVLALAWTAFLPSLQDMNFSSYSLSWHSPSSLRPGCLALAFTVALTLLNCTVNPAK